MSRYIDADALINYLYDYQDCDIDIPKEIAEFPTADVRENVRGEWIFGETMGHSWMKCSNCCVSQSGQTATFSFCPNCGADMRTE